MVEFIRRPKLRLKTLNILIVESQIVPVRTRHEHSILSFQQINLNDFFFIHLLIWPEQTLHSFGAPKPAAWQFNVRIQKPRSTDFEALRLWDPTDTFAVLEHQNPSHDAQELYKNSRSPDFEAQKLWICRLGMFGRGLGGLSVSGCFDVSAITGSWTTGVMEQIVVPIFLTLKKWET